ncbi:nucleotidyltransferase domain-containing protein [Thalassobacillus pellis]|uniref:nucleotidyltransferase domain-containing protein n=1 Tax=Thalassobacillus pellis TaxID=748008 RepID=UPI001EF7F937|nr:hypothetical protein [Thalassobacillus pellis]MBM7554351.1 hypothetical protein [Thalassobacillus pellis]
MFEACQEAARRMAAFRGKWFIAGGWAIDLHIGEETRDHEDIEVAIFRGDQDELLHCLKGWNINIIEDKLLKPWNTSKYLELPIHEIHASNNNEQLEILLNEKEGEHWVYRREPIIRFPLTHMHLHSEQGIPYLNPEIVLLYKAKVTHPKDELDFEAVFPYLSERQKEWLKQALIQSEPEHLWLEKLLL